MKRFWRGFRKASDLREREEIAKIKREQLNKIRELMYGGGGPEAERELRIALQAWKPGILEREIEVYIKQFRSGVSGEQ